MKTFLKIGTFLLGLIIAAGGFTLLTFPEITCFTLASIIGLLMLVSAMARIVFFIQNRKVGNSQGYILAEGILSGVLGLFLLGSVYLQVTVDMIILYASIAWLIMASIFRIMIAIQEKRACQNEVLKPFFKNWWIDLIVGIVFLGAGILSVMNPAIMVVAIGVCMSLNVIAFGGTMVAGSLIL